MSKYQFLKNIKTYEKNNNNIVNRKSLQRLIDYKYTHYPGKKIENVKRDVASRIIQNKFRSQDWSNYLSLNRVPETDNPFGYITKISKGFYNMSRPYKIITLAKITSAYAKWYGKNKINIPPLPLSEIMGKINELISVAKSEKNADPRLTRIRLAKLEKLKEHVVSVKQRQLAARKIQKSYKSYKTFPKTNENFIKYMWTGHSNDNIKRIKQFSLKKYGTNNLDNAIKRIYKKRHESPTVKSSVSTIQKYTRKYQTNRFKLVGQLIEDMNDDPNKRFTFQVKMLSSLYLQIPKVLDFINYYYNKSPKNLITNVIGPCHIKADEVPKKYLNKMYNQMIYVSQEYNKKSLSERKKYLDKLDSSLGGRPCIENMFDAMITSLLEPVFEWTGKHIDPPLVENNKRYLNNVMAKAVSSWQQKLTNNNKSKLPNNLNKRKNMFWSMVKNLELHVRNSEGLPVYSRPAHYNISGQKFKKSNLANTLEYI